MKFCDPDETKVIISPFCKYVSLNVFTGGVFLNELVEKRAQALAEYIVETKATVRAAAKRFDVSKSTVHTDVSLRLKEIDFELYEQARAVLDKNKAERHIRGGNATREKYRKVHLKGGD